MNPQLGSLSVTLHVGHARDIPVELACPRGTLSLGMTRGRPELDGNHGTNKSVGVTCYLHRNQGSSQIKLARTPIQKKKIRPLQDLINLGHGFFVNSVSSEVLCLIFSFL